MPIKYRTKLFLKEIWYSFEFKISLSLSEDIIWDDEYSKMDIKMYKKLIFSSNDQSVSISIWFNVIYIKKMVKKNWNILRRFFFTL